MTRAIPPVAIGLPVYNGEDYLSDALDSLLAQTFPDFELIISDNGSTDRTSAICRAYAQQDNRILYLRSEVNRGGAWNFNNVFSMCRSPYFKFAAHDDLCEPPFLERCYKRLEGAPSDVVLCHPQAIWLDAAGNELGLPESEGGLQQGSPSERLHAYLRSFVYANRLFGVIRAEALRTTRLLGAYDSADMVLLAELAIRGRFWEVEEPLFKRRMHDRSSRAANPTPIEVTQWFDPSTRHRRTFRRNRMFKELFEAVLRAPIPGACRWRCLRRLVAAWFPRYGRMMAWEMWSAARASVTRP